MGISPGDLQEIMRKLLREELTSGDAAAKRLFGAVMEQVMAPEMLASEFNKSVTANTDILASDLTMDEDCVLRIIVSESTGVVFRAKIIREAVEKVLDFNEGSTLKANALYPFDLPVKEGDKVNFRAGAATTINLLNIMKIRTMGP